MHLLLISALVDAGMGPTVPAGEAPHQLMKHVVYGLQILFIHAAGL